MKSWTGMLPRRRWARRGLGFGDFVFGLVFSGLRYAGCAVVQITRGTYRFFTRAIWRRPRPGRSRETAKNLRTSHSSPDTVTSERAFTALVQRPNVRFADIAGLEEAKREIRLRMILPVLYPEKVRQYRVRTGGGLLLYGPPGTGKTMLAKAIATEVEAAFFHVRPSDIMSAQVGQAESNVERLFQIVRRERRAALFIDEVESLIPSRKKNRSTIMQRVISQFLGEVDGLEERPKENVMLFIGATNEPSMIDPAMMRPGRFDAKIYVGLPDRAARRQMLVAALRNRPVAADVDVERMADETEGLSGAEIVNLVERAADAAFLASLEPIAGVRPILADDFAHLLLEQNAFSAESRGETCSTRFG